MEFVQYTKFRNSAKSYFDDIEKGNSFTIIKKGKPIAVLMPFNENIRPLRKKIKKITLKKNVTSTEYIISERRES